MRIPLIAALAVAMLSAAPARAQSQGAGIEGRVDRLEREMRAVQRRVFPNGAGQLYEPQITPPEGGQPTPGTPAANPVADLTARVGALETQVRTLTGEIEQGQFRQRQLEEAFNAFRRQTEARLRTLEEGATTLPPSGGAATGAGGNGGGAATPPRGTGAGGTGGTAARGTGAPARPAGNAAAGGGTRAAITPPSGARPGGAGGGAAAARPDPARATRVAAVERPSTGDAADDGYVYGYRLLEAQLYPEAQRQLREVVRLYPNHRRASYSQNLLGRAYLDAGQPSQAAIALYENYSRNPNGERAADSLFYLAVALKRLNKPAAEICRVYAELTDVYGTRLSEQMRADVATGRQQNNCR